MQRLPKKEWRSRGEELIERVTLTEAADRRVGGYSGGMKRRLDLALALVNRPRILFLDEPTTGLDPKTRNDLWEEVARLAKEEGVTVFLTTQYLEEADQLADRVGIIDRGRARGRGHAGGAQGRDRTADRGGHAAGRGRRARDGRRAGALRRGDPLGARGRRAASRRSRCPARHRARPRRGRPSDGEPRAARADPRRRLPEQTGRSLEEQQAQGREAARHADPGRPARPPFAHADAALAAAPGLRPLLPALPLRDEHRRARVRDEPAGLPDRVVPDVRALVHVRVRRDLRGDGRAPGRPVGGRPDRHPGHRGARRPGRRSTSPSTTRRRSRPWPPYPVPADRPGGGRPRCRRRPPRPAGRPDGVPALRAVRRPTPNTATGRGGPGRGRSTTCGATSAPRRLDLGRRRRPADPAGLARYDEVAARAHRPRAALYGTARAAGVRVPGAPLRLGS